ncbi:PAS domain-containing protein [Sphingomonas sp.]|uniref:helix-turn-helix transcriptional regulator n=1 Tax=Sphingomonas sp. TaxID=28214 RepID=UPI001B073212|nr:PAS domain-containing protein [Sphingomonas sp.]MBO9714545.1 PAS domain-containing protein [Sphingomonas sp.]
MASTTTESPRVGTARESKNPVRRDRPVAKAKAPASDTAAGTQVSDGIVLELMKKLSEAVSTIVDSQTEIVIHDLRHPEASIVSIFNGHVSGRRIGQSVLAGPSGDKALLDIVSARPSGSDHQILVFDSYESKSREGAALMSSSVVAYDGEGPIAAFCLNSDLGTRERILKDITDLLMPASSSMLQPETRSQNIEELIVDIIETSLEPKDVPTARMTKAEKLSSVDRMQKRGLFLIRGAVERVAKRLGTTKFTIYNYLDELGARHAKD